MGRPIQPAATPRAQRVDWVDYAKGFCIVLVVMMHSTLGVENAAGSEGWLHTVVAFAKPFRMPDFFLISGLFLAQVIDRDWRTYLDRKVVHFAYFYLLWTAIQFAFKAPAVRAAARRRGHRLALHRDAVGAVRHALVHLPAADLLRRHQAGPQPARPGAGGLARRRGAGDRANPYRLHGDRRVRQPLRLFLYRLPARAAHLRAGGALARVPRGGARRARDLGPRQRPAGVPRLRRTAVRLARARACRRGRGGRGLGRCWRGPISPRRCATAGGTRSSSTSRSSCRWRRAARCCSRPA